MSNKPQIKIKGKIQDLAKKEKNIKPMLAASIFSTEVSGVINARS
jgi:hypothetical protein